MSFKNTFTKQKIIGKRVATSVTKPYVPDIMVMLGDEAKSSKENVHYGDLNWGRPQFRSQKRFYKSDSKPCFLEV